MTLETGVVIAAIGLTISILSYFFGLKKHSNDDVEKRARFEGEIKATLNALSADVKKIEEKFDRFSEGYYEEIEKRIKEHEVRYHGHQTGN